MNVKRCTADLAPEPPSPSPCKLQKIKQLLKAGKKICPEPPIIEPPPPPPCLAICIEKIKNFPYPPKSEVALCVVERQMTGTARCDEIFDLTNAKDNLPWPGCPPVPPPLPPPPYDPCEEQRRREKIEECKRKQKRYQCMD